MSSKSQANNKRIAAPSPSNAQKTLALADKQNPSYGSRFAFKPAFNASSQGQSLPTAIGNMGSLFCRFYYTQKCPLGYF